MSVVSLNEQIIQVDQNLVAKDGSDLANVKNAIIGTQGGAFIEIKEGALRQYGTSGDIQSEWLPNGVRNVYDSSGNIVIQEDPNG